MAPTRAEEGEFITLLGSAAVWPLAARAQQHAKIPRIGIIDDSPRWNAFRQELRDLGYLEGHYELPVRIDRRCG